jgi:hypothetical protein
MIWTKGDLDGWIRSMILIPAEGTGAGWKWPCGIPTSI